MDNFECEKYFANEKSEKVMYNEIMKRGAEEIQLDGGHVVFSAYTLLRTELSLIGKVLFLCPKKRMVVSM